jgi:hypothetical protein
MAFPFTSATASSCYACRRNVARSGRFSEELTMCYGHGQEGVGSTLHLVAARPYFAMSRGMKWACVIFNSPSL